MSFATRSTGSKTSFEFGVTLRVFQSDEGFQYDIAFIDAPDEHHNAPKAFRYWSGAFRAAQKRLDLLVSQRAAKAGR